MRRPARAAALVAAAACAAGPFGDADGDDTAPDAPPSASTAITPLAPARAAHRASMALRGVRPDMAELRAVRDDPSALGGLVDAWLDDPRFEATVRHQWSEILLMRSEEVRYLPLGPLSDATLSDLASAVGEEPLALAAHIVTTGRPITDLVTTADTVLDATAARIWSRHTYDPEGPDAQVVRYTDGRPAAGLLGTNGLWARWRSAGANYHRGRANLVADALLCADFLGRDVPIDGDIDLADDVAVARALTERPACVSCHQALDPLAANLWAFHPEYTPAAVAVAYATGCQSPFLELCYPFDPYRPAYELGRVALGLRPPGLYGTPTDGLGALGRAIADDPRFGRCMAARTWSYVTQTPVEEAPFEVVASLQQALLDSGWDGRALWKAAVTHPAFLGADSATPALALQLPGPLRARPFQLANEVEALTGFRWWVDVDGLRCDVDGLDLFCYGDADLAQDDAHGFRAMAGGIDGSRVTRPTRTLTPVGARFAAALAEEAAGWVVRRELVQDGTRVLLDGVGPDTTDEAAVRAQLRRLHARVLGELDADVDATYALWRGALDRSGKPAVAWRATLTALLQAPEVLYY